MRKKLVLLTILVFLFILFIITRFFLLKNKDVSGRLKVLSSPTASIFLNNLIIGKTPFEDKVKVGEHILKLIPEGSATDTASWQKKIKVFKNSLTFVDVELGKSEVNTSAEVFTVEKMSSRPKDKDRGEIFVETDPTGAIVYLDNDEKGIAPLILAEVLKGEHEVSVFLPGFFRQTRKVNVTPGFRINGFFKLAVDESQKSQFEPGLEAGKEKEATESAQTKKKMVVVKETPTGWLRVREGPSLSASEAAKIKPGERYEFLDQKSGWYKIKYNGKEGWVSSRYVKIEEGGLDKNE